MAAFREAVRLRPDLAEAHRNLGSVLEKLGRSEEATSAYREALRLRPDLEMPSPAPFFGLILETLGGYDDALVEHRQMIRLRPGYPVAHYNLGTTLRNLGRLEEAAGAFREALCLGRAGWAYETLARQALDEVRSMMEDEKRLASLRSALAAAEAPKTDGQREAAATDQMRLGKLLVRLNRLEEAEAAFREAIRLKPDLASAHFFLGVTLHRLGLYEQAVTTYKKALGIGQGSAMIYRNLGLALQRLGRLQEAEAVLSEAVLMRPNFPLAHYNLGRTLFKLGRYGDAARAYRRAIQLGGPAWSFKPQAEDALAQALARD